MNVGIVNCFDTYEARVELLYEFFVKRGDAVQVLTSNYRHFEKVTRKEAKADYVLLPVKPYQKNLSVARITSHMKFAKDVRKYCENGQFDLLWVLIPPNSLVKEFMGYKSSHPKVKLIYDIIDLWPETMPVEKFKKLPPVLYWRRLRDKYLKSADYVVTECNLFRDKIKAVYPAKRIKTVYLARERASFSEEKPASEFSLCYLGSINNIIDIDCITDIIKAFADREKVVLHIIGDGEKRDTLIENSERAGAEVLFHGKIYEKEEKHRILKSCHYGLNIMKSSVCVGLTMKSMDYFEAGIPIINNIQGDTWDYVKEYNIGINIDDLGQKELFTVENRSEQSRNVGRFFDEVLTMEPFERALDQIMQEVL